MKFGWNYERVTRTQTNSKGKSCKPNGANQKSTLAQSSHAREFHPYVLTEPYVKVSLHTALLVYKSQGS